MRHKNLMLCLAGLILTAMASGCGSTTPSGLMMKGGTWLAKKAITKQVKDGFSKKDKDADQDKAASRRDREQKRRS